jgi:hypothetical protein
VIENGTILFEDGRITAIGANVTDPVARAARRRQRQAHLPRAGRRAQPDGLFEIGGIDVTIDVNELGDFNPNVRAHVAFNPESRHIGVARSNGVLVTVSSPTGGLMSGLSAAMMLDGWTWEQMTLKPEAGLIINWPSAGGGFGGFGGGPPGGGRAPATPRRATTRASAAARLLRDARAYRTARGAAPDRHASDVRLEA